MRNHIKLFAALVLVLGMGTLGYWTLEEGWSLVDALYMTVITITTIGFGEVHQLSDAGRLFTILIIFMGLGLAASFITQVGRAIVESGIRGLYGKRKMKDRVAKLRNHYVICGHGPIGSAICLKLHEMGMDFVVVEQDGVRLEDAQNKGYPTVEGDAASDGTLLAAGIRRASGTVLCIKDDAANVNIALAARELNPDMYIVSRGSDPTVEYRLLRAGANTVVYPLRLGGEQIAHLLAREGGREGGAAQDQGAQDGATSVMGYQLRLHRNRGEARTVAEVMESRRAVRAVAVHRQDGSMEHDPGQEVVLEANDALLVLANESLKAHNQLDLPPLDWTEDLALGIGMIDDEHRLLFQYARNFQTCVLEGRGPEAVERLFDRLVEYTSTHFRHEERFMAGKGYPALEAHKAQHRELVRQVMELNRDKRYVFTDDVWEFLDNWLRNHIMRMDRAFAAYLERREEQQAENKHDDAVQ